jgi:cellulose synthase/poly-beta-1,6-N-acetylglucosamine synthase-like glycosyltransferase
VASDGSTDGTAQRARETGDPRVRVVSSRPTGKPAVLNEVIPTCRAAIVVLTDARQELHPDAIGALLGVLADERVGVVSGELVFAGRRRRSRGSASTGIMKKAFGGRGAVRLGAGRYRRVICAAPVSVSAIPAADPD